jgi:hypothetical protein
MMWTAVCTIHDGALDSGLAAIVCTQAAQRGVRSYMADQVAATVPSRTSSPSRRPTYAVPLPAYLPLPPLPRPLTSDLVIIWLTYMPPDASRSGVGCSFWGVLGPPPGSGTPGRDFTLRTAGPGWNPRAATAAFCLLPSRGGRLSSGYYRAAMWTGVKELEGRTVERRRKCSMLGPLV